MKFHLFEKPKVGKIQKKSEFQIELGLKLELELGFCIQHASRASRLADSQQLSSRKFQFFTRVASSPSGGHLGAKDKDPF